MAGAATTNAGVRGRGTGTVHHTHGRDGAKTPEGLGVYLYSALTPDLDGGREARYEKWMEENCLTLGELDRTNRRDVPAARSSSWTVPACRSARQSGRSLTIDFPTRFGPLRHLRQLG